MPRLSGLDVIDALDSESVPVIVFVTAFDEHAATAFDLDAADYVVKPVIESRFERADRARGGARSRETRGLGLER